MDTGRQPVAGVEVWATFVWAENQVDGVRADAWESILGDPLARQLFSARTSTDGRFSITGFPKAGRSILVARKSGLASPPTHSSSEAWFAGAVGGQIDQRDVQIIVEPSGSIEGQLVLGGTDPDYFVGRSGTNRTVVLIPGKPGRFVTNAVVTLTPLGETWAEKVQVATTSANGQFRFPDVAAGQYRLSGTAGDALGSDFLIWDARCYLGSGETKTNLIVRAAPAGTLAVTVRSSEDGKPVPGAVLSKEDQRFVCDMNGCCTIQARAGGCELHAQQPRFREGPVRAMVYAGKVTNAEFRLTPLPQITGLVQDPEGKPVARAEVIGFIDKPTPGLCTESKADGTFSLTWQTNWDRFITPRSGVIVRDTSRGLAACVPLLAKNYQLPVRLSPGLKISGSLVDKENHPLPHVCVFARLTDPSAPVGLQFHARTGADGRFEFNALPKGYTYSISPRVRLFRGPPIQVDKTQTNDLELAPISVDREQIVH